MHSACVSFTVAAKVAHDAEEDSDLEAEAAMMAAIPAHPGVIACCGLAHVQGLEGRALLLEKADYSLQDLLECVPSLCTSPPAVSYAFADKLVPHNVVHVTEVP